MTYTFTCDFSNSNIKFPQFFFLYINFLLSYTKVAKDSTQYFVSVD